MMRVAEDEGQCADRRAEKTTNKVIVRLVVFQEGGPPKPWERRGGERGGTPQSPQGGFPTNRKKIERGQGGHTRSSRAARHSFPPRQCSKYASPPPGAPPLKGQERTS